MPPCHYRSFKVELLICASSIRHASTFVGHQNFRHHGERAASPNYAAEDEILIGSECERRVKLPETLKQVPPEQDCLMAESSAVEEEFRRLLWAYQRLSTR
jgi:ribosomal protein S4